MCLCSFIGCPKMARGGPSKNQSGLQSETICHAQNWRQGDILRLGFLQTRDRTWQRQSHLSVYCVLAPGADLGGSELWNALWCRDRSRKKGMESKAPFGANWHSHLLSDDGVFLRFRLEWIEECEGAVSYQGWPDKNAKSVIKKINISPFAPHNVITAA